MDSQQTNQNWPHVFLSGVLNLLIVVKCSIS